MNKQSEIDRILVLITVENTVLTQEQIDRIKSNLASLIDTACVEAVQVALANSATPKAHTKQADNRSEVAE